MTDRKKIIYPTSVVLALFLAAFPAAAEEASKQTERLQNEKAEETTEVETDFTVCKVNGVSLTNEQFCETYSYYVEVFANQGYDTSSEDMQTYISNHSYAAVIENELLRQGMEEDGYADYDVLEEQLMEDYECTDKDIEEYYEQVAAQDEENYKDNAALYEQVLYYTDTDIWYIPAGYRKVLEIVLEADDEELENKISAIREKTASGDDFSELVKEYSIDEQSKNEEMLESGFKMNQESIVWDERVLDAVFSENMEQYGDITEPVEIDGYVYLFCYIGDVSDGPIELTDTVKKHIEEILWDNEANERVQEYINKKSAESVILTLADPDYNVQTEE